MTILHSRLESFTMSDLTPKSPVEPKREGNCAGLPGLGLLPPGMLADTHFDARGRLGRLIVGLRDLGLRWGIGVDENTALFLQNGRGTVYGEHGVFIVDTSAAQFSAVGEPFAARQVRVSLLTSGDQWNSMDRTVISTKPPITTSAARTVESVDVFSARKTNKGDRLHPYATTAVMRSLAAGSESEVKARAWPPFASIWVRFRKTPETRNFGDSHGSITITGMCLDIDRRPLFP